MPLQTIVAPGGGGASADPATPFSPLQIVDLLIWLDAADQTTTEIDSSNLVEEWRDKSGNARHVTQPTPSLRPTLIDDGINSLDAIEFFTAEYLFAVDKSWPQVPNITLMSVFQQDATAANKFMAGCPYDGGAIWSSPVFGWSINVDNTGLAEARFNLDILDTDRDWTITNQYADDELGCMTMTYDGTTRRGFKNQVNTFDNTDFAGDISYGSPDPSFAVGVRSIDSVASTFDGHICEIIAYDRALSDAELADLWDYLEAKWGY